MVNNNDENGGVSKWVQWSIGIMAGAMLVIAGAQFAMISDKAPIGEVRKIQIDRAAKWLRAEERYGHLNVSLTEIKVKLERVRQDMAEVKSILIKKRMNR